MRGEDKSEGRRGGGGSGRIDQVRGKVRVRGCERGKLVTGE